MATALFNNPQVREGLAEEGIHILDRTLAVAAEHCTVTDEVTLLDQESVPVSHQALVTELQASFLNAGREARKERATPLKLNGLDGTELRIGLPLQSVHDGIYWRHEPLRLTVLIDAPRERIQAIVERQPDVARLVNNQWLWLHRILPGGGQERFVKGEWHLCPG